jgi:SAM-dependent methyltransferase
MSNADSFFKTYAPHFPDGAKVLDIGAQDVNGSIRTVTPPRFEYVGVDFCEAKGVDVVIDDPYHLPFEDGVADIVVSSSCFEHSEFFWLVFLEIMRCLKPHGLFYLNAPSTGEFHRYPVDCWRFYPDSASAMANWGKRNGLNCALLESYIQVGGQFNDFVAVFLKDAGSAAAYGQKIIDTKTDFENGKVYGEQAIRNQMTPTEYERRMRLIARVASGNIYVK